MKAHRYMHFVNASFFTCVTVTHILGLFRKSINTINPNVLYPFRECSLGLYKRYQFKIFSSVIWNLVHRVDTIHKICPIVKQMWLLTWIHVLSIFLHFIKTTAYHLGRFVSSSPCNKELNWKMTETRKYVLENCSDVNLAPFNNNKIGPLYKFKLQA